MGGPERPTLSPEQIAQQRRAEADKIEGIREGVSGDTRDLLLRFGSRRALAGTSGTSTSSANLPGSLGLFGGRKMQLLNSLGRL